MTSRRHLPVFSADPSAETGMTEPILHELHAALAAWIAHGHSRSIDLKSLPLTDTDRADLERRLGQGEVRAFLSVAGESEVRETGYAGIWWVIHRDGSGAIVADHLEVTDVPRVLMSHRDDIASAYHQLGRDLSSERSAALESSTVEPTPVGVNT